VSDSLGSTFSDPLLHLLENNPEAQRDLLEFRQTLEASCAYYAALRATEVDRERLTAAFEALQDCYARDDKVSRAEEGAADARFHLAIAEASHNAVLLHTIRGLFDLLKRNVVTNIGGMYQQRTETRDMLISQHRDLYLAIIEGAGRASAGSLNTSPVVCAGGVGGSTSGSSARGPGGAAQGHVARGQAP
jgi:GntR family transcriptional repressor for pyruvate dehydrogenase complex